MHDLQFAHHPSRFGQLHVCTLPAAGNDTHPPLLCLHPSPHSGAYFHTVMPMLNAGRAIIAPDYPGYGGSNPPAAEPSIEDYAHAMLDLLDALDITSTDVLGFHTGCLVGAEMALIDPARIRRLLLIDVPYFLGEEREDMYAKSVTLRAADRSRWGFHAAFTYASDKRLPKLKTPTIVIATQSGLLDATLAAAAIIPHARLIDRPDITRPVFEASAHKIAAAIIEGLG